MRGVVTAAEMKALDANTIEKAGIPSLVLMERAALQTVTEIIKRVNTKDKEKILVSGGRIGLQMELAPGDLLAACGGTYAELT